MADLPDRAKRRPDPLNRALATRRWGPRTASRLAAPGSFGSSSATNFSISPTDQNAFEGDLPNDIATSGSGDTEITGVTPGHPESFNVQAAGQWTIKVVAAQ